MNSKVTVKLFAGFEITSEMRMHLRESHQWKESQVQPDENSPDLTEVRFHNKSYIGKFFPHAQLPLQTLQKIKEEFAERVGLYCPEINSEKLELVIFPQPFIH